jgi:hypothetical protein
VAQQLERVGGGSAIGVGAAAASRCTVTARNAHVPQQRGEADRTVVQVDRRDGDDTRDETS